MQGKIIFSIVFALIPFLATARGCSEDIRSFLKPYYAAEQKRLRLFTPFHNIDDNECSAVLNGEVVEIKIELEEVYEKKCELRFAAINAQTMTRSVAPHQSRSSSNQKTHFIIVEKHESLIRNTENSCQDLLSEKQIIDRSDFIQYKIKKEIEAAMLGIGGFMIRKAAMTYFAYRTKNEVEKEGLLFNLFLEAVQERLGDTFLLYKDEIAKLIFSVKAKIISNLVETLGKQYNDFKVQTADKLADVVTSFSESIMKKVSSYVAGNEKMLQDLVEQMVPGYKKSLGLFFLNIINSIETIIKNLIKGFEIPKKIAEKCYSAVKNIKSLGITVFNSLNTPRINCFFEENDYYKNIFDYSRSKTSENPVGCDYQMLDATKTHYRLTFRLKDNNHCEMNFVYSEVSTPRFLDELLDIEGAPTTSNWSIEDSNKMIKFPLCFEKPTIQI